jgi:hypothetical protein
VTFYGSNSGMGGLGRNGEALLRAILKDAGVKMPGE